MTSGGHSMTEGWNLQLQARVRDLETDLAAAEKCLTDLMGFSNTASRGRAREFLRRMAKKRADRAAAIRDVQALIDETGEAQ